MAMLGSRKPTLRNMAATQEAGGSPPRRAPALGASALATVPPPPRPTAPPRQRPNNKAAPPSATNGCRYNPEGPSVGLLSAAVEYPAAARPRVVAAPIRVSARGILEETPDACCCGYCTTPYCSRRMAAPFRVAEFMLACNLCRRRMGCGPLYIYKGEMAFCKPECRYEYILKELHKARHGRRVGAPAPKRLRRGKGKALEAKADKGSDEGAMFFTCAEIP